MLKRPTNLSLLAAVLIALGSLAACKKQDETETETEPTGAETDQPAGKSAEQARGAPAGEGFGEAAGSYDIDPVHSFVLFRVKHLDLAYVHGRFNKVAGELTLGSAPGESRVEVEVDADSLFTQAKKRDDDLKGPDLLNVKQYPKIRFTSTEVVPAGENQYRVTGDLELLGKKSPITTVFEYVGAGDDPWGGYRCGFEGTFTIDLDDHGIAVDSDTIGRELQVTVAVEGKRR